MLTAERLLKIIAALIALLIGVVGYFADKALDQIDMVKDNQAKVQENEIIIMERLGVDRQEIKEAQDHIDEIRRELNKRNP